MWPFAKNRFEQMLDEVKSEPAAPPPQPQPAPVASVAVDDLPPFRHRNWAGDKFTFGFGATDIFTVDYWTLRARSRQLFRQNVYARGLIRRLITNEINTGLHLEATPNESVLGMAPDALADWAENVETLFGLWENLPAVCDFHERRTFGELQQTARRQALVDGDCLAVMTQDPRTRLPRLRVIDGASIQTPITFERNGRNGNKIISGVEVDKNGRHVAYWVRPSHPGTDWLSSFIQKPTRIPAFGEKSGRRIAWLVYGTDTLVNDVRGEPLLAIILQSLREIDRYRDSAQRKALINSLIAFFIKKGEAKPGTAPITGKGAVRVANLVHQDQSGTERRYHISEHMPGAVLEELQHGEEPVGFKPDGTDLAFGEFEAAILYVCAWALEMPPEIATLSFRNNYSASQAAINEFKMYLNASRTAFGKQFCQPVYVDWLLSEVLAGRIEAPTLLESFRRFDRYAEFGAWTSAEWSGHIKPAVDLSKLVNGYEKKLEIGAITHDRATRELTGMKFSRVVKQLKRENEMLAEALSPMAELEASKKPAPAPPPQRGEGGPIDDEPIDDEDDDTSARVLPLRRAALPMHTET